MLITMICYCFVFKVVSRTCLKSIRPLFPNRSATNKLKTENILPASWIFEKKLYCGSLTVFSALFCIQMVNNKPTMLRSVQRRLIELSSEYCLGHVPLIFFFFILYCLLYNHLLKRLSRKKRHFHPSRIKRKQTQLIHLLIFEVFCL